MASVIAKITSNQSNNGCFTLDLQKSIPTLGKYNLVKCFNICEDQEYSFDLIIDIEAFKEELKNSTESRLKEISGDQVLEEKLYNEIQNQDIDPIARFEPLINQASDSNDPKATCIKDTEAFNLIKVVNVYLQDKKIAEFYPSAFKHEGADNKEAQSYATASAIVTKANQAQPFHLHYGFNYLTFEIKLSDDLTVYYYSPQINFTNSDRNESYNLKEIEQLLNNKQPNQALSLMFQTVEIKEQLLNSDITPNRAFKTLEEYVLNLSSCIKDLEGYLAKPSLSHTLSAVSRTPKMSVREHSKLLRDRHSFNHLYSYSNLLSSNNAKVAGEVFASKLYNDKSSLMGVNAKRFEKPPVELLSFLRIANLEASNIYQGIQQQSQNHENSNSDLKKLEQLQSQLRSRLMTFKDLIGQESTPINKLTDNLVRAIHNKPNTKFFESIKAYLEHSVEGANDRSFLAKLTLDKLFEYYCLFRILNMLIEEGYTPSKTHGAYKYQYNIDLDNFNDPHVANTYILEKGSVTVTLYYQAVIFKDHLENGLMLLSSDIKEAVTKTGINFYAPDFVLKIQNKAKRDIADLYVILDAKFASKQNIKTNYLPELTKKYVDNVRQVQFNQAAKNILLANSINTSDSTLNSKEPGNKDHLLLNRIISSEELESLPQGSITKIPVNVMYALQGRVAHEYAEDYEHSDYYHLEINRPTYQLPLKLISEAGTISCTVSNKLQLRELPKRQDIRFKLSQLTIDCYVDYLKKLTRRPFTAVGIIKLNEFDKRRDELRDIFVLFAPSLILGK